MKKRNLAYFAFAVIVVIPALPVAFLLGGADAVLGTDLHIDFEKVLQKICVWFCGGN